MYHQGQCFSLQQRIGSSGPGLDLQQGHQGSEGVVPAAESPGGDTDGGQWSMWSYSAAGKLV